MRIKPYFPILKEKERAMTILLRLDGLKDPRRIYQDLNASTITR